MKRIPQLHLFQIYRKRNLQLFYVMELLRIILHQGTAIRFNYKFRLQKQFLIVLNSYSSRSGGGLVDYDDDEDDEDYKPPPKKQSETVEEDEGALHTVRLKRKPLHQDKDSEKVKTQRPGKNLKMKDGVFSALCSKLSQAVLPTNNAVSSQHSMPRSIDGNESSKHENPEVKDRNALRNSTDGESSLDEENHAEKQPISSKKCSDPLLKPSDSSRQLNGEDCSLIPPNSSPEMTVNGS